MCFDGEHPSFFQTSTPLARKAHRCCECCEPIPQGAKYHRASGKWNGEVDSFATCLRCAQARDLVAALERAEGCSGSEAYCPFGQLSEACAEYDRELSDALHRWADLLGPTHRVTKGQVIDAFTRQEAKMIAEARNRADERRIEQDRRGRGLEVA